MMMVIGYSLALLIVFFSVELHSAQASQIILPTNTNIYYSPYGWLINDSSASSINSGSYFRTLIRSTFIQLTFDVKNMVNPPSQIYYRVDNGPLTSGPVKSLIEVPIPLNLTNSDIPFHTLEVIIKSTTETQNRWSFTGNSTRVIFTGLVIDGTENSGMVSGWEPADMNILIYGDSITEGVLTLGAAQHFDTDRNDATLCWSFRLGYLLGAEVSYYY